jgi:hypothetical protein
VTEWQPISKIAASKCPGSRPGAVTKYMELLEQSVPNGWSWAVYSASGPLSARAVLSSPCRRVHIGVNGRTPDEAIAFALVEVSKLSDQ